MTNLIQTVNKIATTYNDIRPMLAHASRVFDLNEIETERLKHDKDGIEYLILSQLSALKRESNRVLESIMKEQHEQKEGSLLNEQLITNGKSATFTDNSMTVKKK